jgi:signal peptidase I
MAREVALYEIPKKLERARVLDDSLLQAYEDSVKSKYNSEKVRQTLLNFGSSDGELTGSNIPMLIHLQESGLLGDSRLATRQDLETAVKFNPDFLQGYHYTDFGVALRGDKVGYSPNEVSTISLVAQFKHRGIDLGKGKLIPLSALTQKESSDSYYGLALSLRENVSVDSIEDLSKHKWNETTNDGLAKAGVGNYGRWYSNGCGLGGSNSCGRVVIISKETN